MLLLRWSNIEDHQPQNDFKQTLNSSRTARKKKKSGRQTSLYPVSASESRHKKSQIRCEERKIRNRHVHSTCTHPPELCYPMPGNPKQTGTLTDQVQPIQTLPGLEQSQCQLVQLFYYAAADFTETEPLMATSRKPTRRNPVPQLGILCQQVAEPLSSSFLRNKPLCCVVK